MNDEPERPGPTQPAARRFDDLDRRAASRVVAVGVGRTLGASVFLLVLYYRLPLGTPSTFESIVRILVATAAIVVVVWIETRAVDRAAYPFLRAVEALAVSVSIVVVAFAHSYLVLSRNEPAAFSEDLGNTSALYFTVTTLATVGYGDIHARTDEARIVVMVQMAANVVLIGAVVRLILHRARAGVVSRTAR